MFFFLVLLTFLFAFVQLTLVSKPAFCRFSVLLKLSEFHKVSVSQFANRKYKLKLSHTAFFNMNPKTFSHLLVWFQTR